MRRTTASAVVFHNCAETRRHIQSRFQSEQTRNPQSNCHGWCSRPMKISATMTDRSRQWFLSNALKLRKDGASHPDSSIFSKERSANTCKLGSKVQCTRLFQRNCYTSQSYARAIRNACAKAFPPGSELDRPALLEWNRKHAWAPNQLRHSMATNVRKSHGIEAAQVLLGHSEIGVTQIYAEADREKAIEVIRKIG